MDAQTYLEELTDALSGLPPVERDEAIAFYSEYFEEVGEEGFENAAATFGTPKVLATQIKAEAAMRSLGGKKTEWFAQQPAAQQAAQQAQQSAAASGSASASTQPLPGQPGQPGQPSQAGQPEQQQWQAASGPQSQPAPGQAYYAPTPQQQAPQKKTSGMSVVLIVLLAIFALPIGLPLAAALFALVIAVFATLFALFVSFAAVVIALLAAGILAIICGFILLFTQFPVGLFYLGGGLVSLGLMLLFTVLFVKLAQLIVKGVAYLFNAIRRKLSKKDKEAQNA